MSSEYRHNHYVPQWYQRRFLLPGQKERKLFLRDLNPGHFVDGRGVRHRERDVKYRSLRDCFAEEDLYTLRFEGIDSTEIETQFFGKIDRRGRRAIDLVASYEHGKQGFTETEFSDLMLYMSTQKLRSPKGLRWLRKKMGVTNDWEVLPALVQLRGLFSAIWTESVWLIADAKDSPTKFIISDHPVTVYNRACGPRSDRCRDSNDPDIWLNGTHTTFPLSLDKILILTNLSWVRNPYQREISERPNPRPLRDAVFKMTDIQTGRFLTEEEVRQINFITMSRARQYIASPERDWLYPERYVSKSDWRNYGHGYLLMPDPRPIDGGGTIMWGGGSGPGGAMDEYGFQP